MLTYLLSNNSRTSICLGVMGVSVSCFQASICSYVIGPTPEGDGGLLLLKDLKADQTLLIRLGNFGPINSSGVIPVCLFTCSRLSLAEDPSGPILLNLKECSEKSKSSVVSLS